MHGQYMPSHLGVTLLTDSGNNWGSTWVLKRAIPGYGPVKASPPSTAKVRSLGLRAMLLAPAGNLEAAKQALQAGADAVYVGLRGLIHGTGTKR